MWDLLDSIDRTRMHFQFIFRGRNHCCHDAYPGDQLFLSWVVVQLGIVRTGSDVAIPEISVQQVLHACFFNYFYFFITVTFWAGCNRIHAWFELVFLESILSVSLSLQGASFLKSHKFTGQKFSFLWQHDSESILETVVRLVYLVSVSAESDCRHLDNL